MKIIDLPVSQDTPHQSRTLVDPRAIAKMLNRRHVTTHLIRLDPEAVTGNHVHRKTHEALMCVEGTVFVILVDTGTKKEIGAKFFSTDCHQLLIIEPGVAHVVKAHRAHASVLVFKGSTPRSSDTFPYIIPT